MSINIDPRSLPASVHPQLAATPPLWAPKSCSPFNQQHLSLSLSLSLSLVMSAKVKKRKMNQDSAGPNRTNKVNFTNHQRQWNVTRHIWRTASSPVWYHGLTTVHGVSSEIWTSMEATAVPCPQTNSLAAPRLHKRHHSWKPLCDEDRWGPFWVALDMQWNSLSFHGWFSHVLDRQQWVWTITRLS